MTDPRLSADEELACVIAVLDAAGIPTELAPGVPYTVHARVQAALDASKPQPPRHWERAYGKDGGQ